MRRNRSSRRESEVVIAVWEERGRDGEVLSWDALVFRAPLPVAGDGEEDGDEMLSLARD